MTVRVARKSGKNRKAEGGTAETALQRVRRVLCSGVWVDCDEANVTASADLVEDLKFDSLDFCELAMALEEEFQIEEITADEMEHVKTVGDVVALVEKKQQEAPRVMAAQA